MRTTSIINISLRVIGVAGLAGITVVAPNALQGLAPLLKQTKINESEYSKLLKELKRQGLVHISQSGDEVSYALTPAGAYRVQDLLIKEVGIPRPDSWDKRWRIIAFDIPSDQSKQRIYFTRHLSKLGLRMFQRSMWIHPFPCFDQVEQIAAHYNVLRYCSLLEIARLDELSTRRQISRFEHLLKEQA